MTFYDELGLRPDASPDEIRRAYRNLARLLHPDQQEDEVLRRVAELQMMRLNMVHATLSDPTRRQEYDDATSVAVAPRPRAPRLSGREVAWFMAGLAVATLYWGLSPRPAPAPRTEFAPVAQATNPPAAKRPAKRSSGVPSRARPEPAETRLRSTDPTELRLPSPPPAHSAPAPVAVLAAPAVHEPLMLEPPAALPPAAPRFSGTWIYVPPRVGTPAEDVYPAEYIEAVVLEDSGQIRGRYRARYRVPDRPISSEVAFRFEGQVEGDAAGLTWAGAGGSEGRVKLVLLSSLTMRVDWVATLMGTQLGLASGSAILTRRQEP